MMDPSSHHDSNGYQLPQAPALMNPPPQIFGNYSHDGLPMTANLPDMVGPMFTDGTLLDESNEAKRRRIARVRSLHISAEGGG